MKEPKVKLSELWDEVPTLDEWEPDDLGCPYELKLAEEYHRGLDHGLKQGYADGEKDVRDYNVVLDGEMIEKFLDLKNFVLSYTKEPYTEHLEHNRMVHAIHRKVMEVVDVWAMNQIIDYMIKVDSENNDED